MQHRLFVVIFSVWPAQRSPFGHRRNAQLAGGNLTWEVSTVFTFLISNNLQLGFVFILVLIFVFFFTWYYLPLLSIYMEAIKYAFRVHRKCRNCNWAVVLYLICRKGIGCAFCVKLRSFWAIKLIAWWTIFCSKIVFFFHLMFI